VCFCAACEGGAFEPERGIGCRAIISVMSLAGNHCYECWMDLEVS
jgi:hypothetical protein